mgnify:CR=1 FL=1
MFASNPGDSPLDSKLLSVNVPIFQIGISALVVLKIIRPAYFTLELITNGLNKMLRTKLDRTLRHTQITLHIQHLMENETLAKQRKGEKTNNKLLGVHNKL